MLSGLHTVPERLITIYLIVAKNIIQVANSASVLLVTLASDTKRKCSSFAPVNARHRCLINNCGRLPYIKFNRIPSQYAAGMRPNNYLLHKLERLVNALLLLLQIRMHVQIECCADIRVT